MVTHAGVYLADDITGIKIVFNRDTGEHITAQQARQRTVIDDVLTLNTCR
jgi:hypothetical protein